MHSGTPTRIVVAGGGFGGVYAAHELERALGRESNVEITLVSRENFLLFTPMLHEVAASDLDLTHIVTPIRRLLRRTRFFNGDVEGVDLPGRHLLVTHGSDGHHHELEYDHLVLALGSVTNFYGLPGLAEHGLTMKTLGDAIHLRNRLIANLEEADFECCSARRAPLLTVVVAGGGFAGVETIAAVNDFLRDGVSAYGNLDAHMLRLVLVHSGDTILPDLGASLGGYAQRKLAERGVEIITEARVSEVDAEGVTLADGSRITTSTVVWTAGTSPSPLLSGLPCPLDRGRVRVDETLCVPEWPGVWAVGDCASVPRPDGGTYPPTAQHALRQAKTVARNLAATIRGGSMKPFRFAGLGALAAIGKRTGVARVFGFQFSGFLAWWLWRTIYLSKLPGWDRKVRVMVDWTLDLILPKDLVQYLTFRGTAVSHAHEGWEAESRRTKPVAEKVA